MSVVHCKLPAAGLGNQLFPLMKASVFAQLNDLPLVVTNYHQLRIGPYLRGEKSKRNYNDYFSFQKSFPGEYFDKMRIRIAERTCEVIEEPALASISGPTTGKTIFRFSQIPHWSSYFEGLRDHRLLAISLLNKMVRPSLLQKLDKQDPPQIGVHIRMGDFRKLSAGEDFSKLGTVRTPEDYFLAVIQQIRTAFGGDTPVSIFSDGYEKELSRILSLPNVKLVEGNPDIVDMLLLSRSKVVVTSAGSTFGYWSGFLSDAPIIMHPDHIHEPIRSSEEQASLYEGPFSNTAVPFIKKTQSVRP